MDVVFRKTLERNLDRHGCLEPLLVQRSTGYVISGNQRLAWMDKRHGKDRSYEVQVAFVDMGDPEAEAFMIHMNNRLAQGDWNLPALEECLLELAPLSLQLEATSFDQLSIEMLLPESVELGKLFSDPGERIEKAAADIHETKRISREQREKNRAAKTENDPNYFVVLVFGGIKEKAAFCARLGVPPNERYISAGRLELLEEGSKGGKR